jgi:hypothetical protein
LLLPVIKADLLIRMFLKLRSSIGSFGYNPEIEEKNKTELLGS